MRVKLKQWHTRFIIIMQCTTSALAYSTEISKT